MGKELHDVYGDLFGGKKDMTHTDSAKTGTGKERADGRSAADPEESLKRAEEALKEAEAAFGGLAGMNADRMKAIMDEVDRDFGITRDGKDASGNKEAEKESAAAPESPADETKTDADDGEPLTETAEAAAEEKQEEPETDPMDDLNELIGLGTIKHDVKELYDFTKVQKMRADAGMKTVPVSKHLVFSGNPGTGKTTVARILARLYKKIGVLSKGQLVETDRSGLVAGYVGQTAVKTQQKIKEAMGGVLFIDEAYALAKAESGQDFGQEAIDTMLKAMEDHRDDLVVIVAGYTEPMKTFVESNPGLKSRFNKFIEFPDYTIDELIQIFDLDLRKYQYVIDDDARERVKQLIMLDKAENSKNFANARMVRNLFETIITNQARRIAAMETPAPEEMQRIILADLSDDETDIVETAPDALNTESEEKDPNQEGTENGRLL